MSEQNRDHGPDRSAPERGAPERGAPEARAPEPGAPDERIFEENLCRLLAAAEPAPRLSADRAAKMLREIESHQRSLGQQRQRTQSPEPISGDTRLAGSPKEQPMNRPFVPSMFRKTGSRRPWQSLAATAAVLLVFLALVFRGGRPPDEPNPEPGPDASLVKANKIEADRVTRKKLDDGTVVVAQAGAKFTLAAPRELSLEQGEIYLIVAKSDKPFVVTTPHGEAKATGTRFYVSANSVSANSVSANSVSANSAAATIKSSGETRAAVAQGTVTLSGRGGSVALRAGEQAILAGERAPTRQPAPRLSYLVSWAKDALTQDELLVKKPEPEAGLVAVDPWGQEVVLTLRKYHVDVFIEDGIARTTIDQTFFNHNPWNTEGTFYFPLPPDASVSRLAMYVSGKLNEGGMVPRLRGQQIYDEIRYQNRDPALLEMMEGNVFKMRIFPLEGRQEKRIFLSYTQTLSELYGTLRYWFPMDHTHQVAKDLSIRVRVKDGADHYVATSSTHELAVEPQDEDLVLTYSAADAKPDQDLLLHLLPKGGARRTQFATFAGEGFNYVFCRLTPELAGAVPAGAPAVGRAEDPSYKPRQWIVLNDVSASRSKIDVAAQRYIVERLLAEADDGDKLAVIDVNTAAHVVTRLVPMQDLRSPNRSGTRGSRVPLSPQHDEYPWPERELLGATNLQAAFEAAAAMIQEQQADNPHILYLGDGVATDGKTDIQPLLKAMPERATFVGIGVGKKVESRLLQAAADATGGMFATINPDEDIDWRVFDLLAALNTPRLTGVEVEFQDAAGRPVEAITYPSARALSAGEVLMVVGRTTKSLPAKAVLRGTLGGKKFEQSYSLEGAKSGAGYLPRLWAKLHIDELLKEGDKHKTEIERLSMQYYVVTPYTSLIVLENDKMYEEFKVERGRKDHWALYGAPPEIPVVREEMDWARWHWWGGGGKGEDAKVLAKAKPQTVQDIVESVQFRIDAPFYYTRPRRDDCSGRFALYQLAGGKAKPTRLLTYLYLLASGRTLPAGKTSAEGGTEGGAEGGTAKDDPAGGPRGGQGAGGGELGYFLMLPGLPPHQAREGLDPARVSGFDLAFRMQAGGKRPGMPPLEMDFLLQEKAESLKELMLPSLVEDDRRRLEPRGWMPNFGATDSAPDAKKMLAPALLGTDGGFFYPPAVAGQLPPDLLNSYRRALGTRWARINRDIRQFNRQYGYWDDWSYQTDYGLDLGGASDWYGGLQELLDKSKDGKNKLPPMVSLFDRISDFEMPALERIPQGEAPMAPMLAKLYKKQAPTALAWVSYFGETMKSLPGTASVLAADHLASRLGELKKAQATAALTEEQKQELAEIEQAIAGVDAAAARLESSAPFWSYRGWDYRPQPAAVEPPTIQAYQGYNWSYDLTSYAPGLHSTSADVLAEVVAQYGQPRAEGKVSDDARRRIDAARAAIKPVRIRYGKDGAAVLAAAGDRFAVTQRTDMYLEERVVCDGRDILHLYGELGLAARRPANALRLGSLRQLAPHFVEPAEELGRMFDIELGEANENGFTLRLTPIWARNEDQATPEKGQKKDDGDKLPEVRLTMQVRSDGLVTDKAVFMDGKPTAKLVYEYADGSTESKQADGQVTARWFDKEGKEVSKFEFTAQPLKDATAFDAKLADYVVFDMPLRKPSYYAEQLKDLVEKKDPGKEARLFEEAGVTKRIDLLRHQALASIQELQWRRWYGSNEEAQKALGQAAILIEKAGGQRKLGDLTLLGSTGVSPVDFTAKQPTAKQEDAAKPQPRPQSAVARYFGTRHDGWTAADKLAKDYPQTLVGHLAAYHATIHHSTEPALFQRLVKDFGDSPLLLAAAYHCATYGNRKDVWHEMYDDPRWRGMAVLMSGRLADTPERRKRLDGALAAWYRDAAADGAALIELPVTTEAATHLNAQEGWEGIVRDQFARAKKAEGAAALLRFAETATTWGKKELAEQALALARERLQVAVSLREVPPVAERPGHTKRPDHTSAKLALGQAYWACGKPKEALELYDSVLADLKAKKLPASAALLGATARLAAAAGDAGRAIELEEAALAIEHERLPEMINLQAYRHRYQWLWQQLSAKVQETVGKDSSATGAWLARAERVWRQWHDVDRDNPSMIQQMATLQRAAGREAQAWLYLSTLIDERPKDAASYAGVAQWYAGRNELTQAEQFYAKAYPWDEANPQWLVERAQLLDRLDRKADARQLYQQVVDGKWPPGRQGYVEQAKKALQ